jgi:bifunctional non-homologous end joining protein LigD
MSISANSPGSNRQLQKSGKKGSPGRTHEPFGAKPEPTEGNLSSAISAELERAGAPRQQIPPQTIELMLAEPRDQPFSAPGWLFELKYDGYRLLAARDGGRAQLLFRRGRDATALFPELAAAVAKLPFENITLDGEVVVLDEAGIPTFQRLQKRGQLLRAADIRRASIELPATLFVFDLLGWQDFDLRPLPLALRKSLLQRLLPKAGPLRFADHVMEQGMDFFAQVRQRGLEGILAKKGDSPYQPGRWNTWLKICVERTADLVVVGFTEPDRTRIGFGALHLGTHRGGELTYAGRVGTGFSEKQLKELRVTLEPDRRATPVFKRLIPMPGEHRWVEPKYVCEVRFKQWTDDGLLRAPVFVRMREDKQPEECLQGSSAPNLPQRAPAEASQRRIPFSNLEKVFWPDEGYTKGDLVNFYREISAWLLPYLRDRPVVLTRYPDGIRGKSFFQKDAPNFVPDWIRTERMWSEDSQREIAHFICEDEDSLVFLANLGTIPLHIGASRAKTLEQPDWCILDLDPKEAPFSYVVRIARAILALSEQIELPCFVKTSGSSGLHLLLPLGAQCNHQQSTALAELMARVIAQEMPEIATVTRNIADRGKRVYLDYLQNGHGKLLAAPFCVRPIPGAPVSTPLSWNEVGPRLHPRQFTLANVVRRITRQKTDPLRAVLELRPDLPNVLNKLGERLHRLSRPVRRTSDSRKNAVRRS